MTDAGGGKLFRLAAVAARRSGITPGLLPRADAISFCSPPQRGHLGSERERPGREAEEDTAGRGVDLGLAQHVLSEGCDVAEVSVEG